MNDELNGRIVYSPRGRNAEDDLAACILQAARIFWMNGQLTWITDGKRVPVVRNAVIEICRRFIVTEHPVNRGTEAEPNWVVERRPFVPNELMVRNLIRESLPRRAPMVQAEAPPRVEEAPQAPSNPLEAARGAQELARYAEPEGGRLRQEIETGQRRAAQFQT
jgi:hypothetical protein